MYGRASRSNGALVAPKWILLSCGLRLKHFVNGGSGCTCEVMDHALCMASFMQCADLFVNKSLGYRCTTQNERCGNLISKRQIKP